MFRFATFSFFYLILVAIVIWFAGFAPGYFSDRVLRLRRVVRVVIVVSHNITIQKILSQTDCHTNIINRKR